MLFSTIVYNIKPKYHRGESTQRYFNTHAPCGKPRAFLFISRAKLPVRHYARLRFAIYRLICSLRSTQRKCQNVTGGPRRIPQTGMTLFAFALLVPVI